MTIDLSHAPQLAASALPEVKASNLQIVVHRTIPSNWPSATNLGEARCHIFQTREFLTAWLESFGAGRRYTPLYVEVRDPHGTMLLLLALTIETRRGLRTLTFLDQGHADYNAPVLFPEAANQAAAFTLALWQHLLTLLPPFDVLRLEKMPEHVGGLANPLFAFATAPNGESCHGNDLTKPLAEVEKALLSPKEMKSKLKSLEKLAPVRFIVADDAETRRHLLDTLIAQKQRRFEDTRVPGFAENPEALDFLEQASDIFGRSGNLFICALAVGDEITAVQWGLRQDRVLYALMTSFAAGKWVKFSCGRILNFRLLQWLHAAGFTYLDQGFGDEPYKLQNADTTVPLSQAVIGYTAHGRRHLARQAMLARIRALPQWESMRQLKWVVLRRLRRSPVDAKR